MVRTSKEILEALKSKLDDTSDETLALIEDVSDTLNDYDNKNTDKTDWKAKYEENDKEWRKKYRDRFFSSDGEDDDPKGGEEEKPPITKFEDLFTTKGE